MGELEGRVVLVTGAGRGIGAEAAVALAAAGAQVVVTARTTGSAQAVADRIAGAGGSALALGCDVASYPSVRECLARLLDRLGRLDALVNNAGIIGPIAAMAEADPQAWALTQQVNLAGAFFAVREALPPMLAQGAGTIVNLSSGAARAPQEGWSAYCASKAGLAMLTRSIHHEYGARGITAIGFAPGVVDTGMQVTIRASGINPVSRLPRSALRPAEEPGRMIAWLCTPSGVAFAGQEIDVRDPALRQAAGLPPLSA